MVIVGDTKGMAHLSLLALGVGSLITYGFIFPTDARCAQ